MTDSTVAIVGGGVVGLTAACLLARQRFSIQLVDGSPPPVWDSDVFSNRVSAINIASQRLLESIGVWDAIVERRVAPVRAMEVWDSVSDARIRFDAHDTGEPALAHIVENDLICATMVDRLQQNYSVKLRYGDPVRSIDFDTEQALLGLKGDPSTITSALVIAADGGRSTVRRLAGINVDEIDFGQDAVVATIECELPHRDTALQCFTPAGPVALLPLPGRFCSMVWSQDRPAADEPPIDDPDVIARGLNQLFENRLGQLSVTGDLARFPLWHRHARHYVVDRLALVGDAAHTTHPLAGLGANIGLLDVAALAECMEHALLGGKSPTSLSTLRRYARWRRGENAVVLGTMQAFKAGFGGTGSGLADAMLARLRTGGFSLADRTTPLKQLLALHAMGMAGDIPALCRSDARV